MKTVSKFIVRNITYVATVDDLLFFFISCCFKINRLFEFASPEREIAFTADWKLCLAICQTDDSGQAESLV